MEAIRVEVNMNPDLPLPVSEAEIGAAVRHVLRAEDVAEAEISVTLLDDPQIAQLNQEYLGHQGPTDVISFALHGEGETPLGDVYIGEEQALRQAADLGVEAGEEILRLAVHGTLHVLGYEHPEEGDRSGSAMYRRQEALLLELARGRGPRC